VSPQFVSFVRSNGDVVESGIVTNLTLAQNASWQLPTYSIPAGSVSVRVACSTNLPRNSKLLGALVTLPMSAVQTALSGASSVGASTWQQFQMTMFTDRWILHPDANGGSLRMRLMPCTPVPGMLSSMDCVLPTTNPIGSLWQLHVGWGLPLVDGNISFVGSFQTSNTALYGTPLTLSFPVLMVNGSKAARFVVQSGGTRIPPGGSFEYSSPPDGFDTSPATGPVLSSDVLSFPGVVNMEEILYFPTVGDFSPSSSFNMLMYVGDVSKSINMLCPIKSKPSILTFLLCQVPIPTSAISSSYQNMPFQLWDSKSLVVFPIVNARYNYLSGIPQLINVSGCLPAAKDDDWPVLVQTIDCPTAGGVMLSIVASNIVLPVVVYVGTAQVTTGVSLTSALGGNTNQSILNMTVTLPPGTGQGLTIQVIQGSLQAKLENSVSYAAPVIFNMTGCVSNVPVKAIIGCNRKGGDSITILGKNFGDSGARVIVAGQTCQVSLSSHNKIVCTLQSGSTSRAQIIILQATGRLYVPDPNTISVSYEQCQKGFVANQTNPSQCEPCQAGYFSNTESAASCTPCDPGKYNNLPGQQSCMSSPAGFYVSSSALTATKVCAPGQFAAALATACTLCPLNTFRSQPGATDLSNCTQCPEFSTTDTSGASSCICNAGYFYITELNVTQCMACPLGIE
jgi:hypothetical protein